MNDLSIRVICLSLSALGAVAVTLGCRQPETSSDAPATPVYNRETGRLEQIVSDRDGDGTIDTRAYMDGTRVVRVEIDRDADDEPDRYEFYESSASDPQSSIIVRAEEVGGPDRTVIRREVYANGALQRVEEDTDLDGRLDKWETYKDGRLLRVDLDLAGSGRPTRRLTYGPNGAMERIEADPDGDGVFEPFVPGEAPR